MATTLLTSTLCPTEDMAKNSLAGSIAEYGKGGHKVSVREMVTQETDGGWIATVSIEIEDLEEEEEEKPENKKSEFRKAEDIIEKENELYALTHLDRSSQAERAFPEGDAPPNADELTGVDTTPHYNEDNQDRETIGIDQNPAELSETLESDFSQAMTNEPPPEGTLPDSALVYPAATAPDVPVSEMSVEELEREVKRRKQEERDLAAAMAADIPENPAPPSE